MPSGLHFSDPHVTAICLVKIPHHALSLWHVTHFLSRSFCSLGAFARYQALRRNAFPVLHDAVEYIALADDILCRL